MDYTYTIENYHKRPVFCNFLPGIAGLYGVPAWCFFVNRGQCVTSFGVADKDHAVMEFTPAHTACQLVETKGFRSFIKVNGSVTELFADSDAPHSMTVGLNSLSLQTETGALRVFVDYFVPPDLPVGALARRLRILNSGGVPVELELLDGMPAVVPFGVSDWTLKNMVQTGMAWMETECLENRVPRFRVRASMDDSARVSQVEGCAFALATDGENLLDAIVDPAVVFGYDTSLRSPTGFAAKPLCELARSRQMVQNTFPCFFSGLERRLAPGESTEICMLIGQAGSDALLDRFLRTEPDGTWFGDGLRRTEEIALRLTADAATESGSERFDAYCRRTYLDNCLRGGWPVKLGGHVLHPFTRKHGDLERDYNYFLVTPEPFSQGNGNFRDVNQNRRCDVSFAPFVEKENIVTFFSLLQMDGYDPLQICPETFRLNRKKLPSALNSLLEELPDEYTPGKLWLHLAELPEAERRQSFDTALAASEKQVNAVFGEGYWSDHWTYCLDLVEDFLRIWPERRRELLCDTPLRWYRSGRELLPARQRYTKTPAGIRQYKFLTKHQEEGWETDARGAELHSNLLEKLSALCMVKFAALDPWAVGIDMEGGKPGWYDALNGLPGLLGSSVAESCELVRFLRFTAEALGFAGGCMELLAPLADLAERLDTAVTQSAVSLGRDTIQLAFHRDAQAALEEYRSAVYAGASGDRVKVSAAQMAERFGRWAEILAARLAMARREDGLMPTYFYYEVTEWRESEDGIVPVDFARRNLPLFLEGPVHYMKLLRSGDDCRALHKAVMDSELFDSALGMLRVNAPLDRSQLELGRAAAFTPGWLENASIWLHMEYKYMLELLKNGLYQEFFSLFRQAAVPFLDEDTYGRSCAENVSFLVSSFNPEPALWGRGFVARLSGSTAEFLQMWQLMLFGPQPFVEMEHGLALSFCPAIPAYLIGGGREIRAAFMRNSTVRYHFSVVKDYFPGSYSVRQMICPISTEEIRSGKGTEIDVWLEPVV